jgi:hypothetical protein
VRRESERGRVSVDTEVGRRRGSEERKWNCGERGERGQQEKQKEREKTERGRYRQRETEGPREKKDIKYQSKVCTHLLIQGFFFI